MDAEPAQILARFASARISGPVALMELLIATEDVAQVQQLVETAGAQALTQLLAENRSGCERVVSMLRAGNDSPEPAPSIEEGIAFCQRLFDASVLESASCSVALYSLDNPALLDEATRELVALLREQGLLSPAAHVLDLGCGIGRFERALSPYVRSIVGTDVSAQMVRVAREACGALPNVRIEGCSGRDLQPFDDGSLDLILSVDAFPYLHQSGPALVQAHLREAARVLRPGGHLALFNLSYGRDLEDDRRELQDMARSALLTVRVPGVEPFRLWNGRFFLLQRPR